MSALTLDGFLSRIAHAALPKPEASVVFGQFDNGIIKTFDIGVEPPALMSLPDGLRFAAMVVITRWSPDDHTPFADTPLYTVVERFGPSGFFVGYGGILLPIPNIDAPWFALGTASGLRAALQRGEPLRLKQTANKELHKKVYEATPPTDEFGDI